MELAKSKKYHVFLNHRGPDTKNNLAGLLYRDLRAKGFHVFLDKHELKTGECVGTAIEAAVRSSSIHVALMSRRYAESTSCLNELDMMLRERDERGSTVFPIFYDVKPSDLRRTNQGPYAKAFKKHTDRGRVEVDMWKKALMKVADIKGHEFDTKKDDWPAFITEIVAEIVNLVDKKVTREPLEFAEHPVGLDKAAENLSNKIAEQMDSSSDPIIVGMAGSCGSGKTALVTQLHNLINSLFQRSSFQHDICQTRSGLNSFQEKLLFDLLGHSVDIRSPLEGERELRERLKGLSSPVLIVLDGLESQEQIDHLLLPVKDVIGKGSLILITSHDRGLLEHCRQVNFLYDMELMEEKDARELFCQHAFPTSEAPIGFEDLVTKMVKVCGGYPLALKVLGAGLFGKPMGLWKSRLTNLQKQQFPNELIEKIVKASYDSLEKNTKMIFLDVAAAFFERLDSHVREDSHLVVRFQGEGLWPLLDSIETLRQKCLVELKWIDVDDHGQVKYNDDGHEVLAPYRDCEIRMNKAVVDVAKKIGSEELSRGQSSDFRPSYTIQHTLEGPPPHMIIRNCHGIKGFPYPKSATCKAYKKDYYHLEFEGLLNRPFGLTRASRYAPALVSIG